MSRSHARTIALAAALAAACVTAAAPALATEPPAPHHSTDTAVSDNFRLLKGSTPWQETGRLKLNFPTFHTEGIAFTADRIFLSAVEITEPTVKYPSPQDGLDRTPGKGVGHLFVMDARGNLQQDIVLGEGDMYHPGGVDFDGANVWVPVSEYRPNSRTLVYSIDAKTLQVTKRFEVKDHFGGIVYNRQTGHLFANTWGSRRWAEWTVRGQELRTWENSSFFIDYQDCQYVANDQALCGGIAGLPQSPSVQGSYELGGVALIDLRKTNVMREIPFQKWSTAGHVATRNPIKVSASGNKLTMRVAPDNGEEGNGTEIITYEATIG